MRRRIAETPKSLERANPPPLCMQRTRLSLDVYRLTKKNCISLVEEQNIYCEMPLSVRFQIRFVQGVTLCSAGEFRSSFLRKFSCENSNDATNFSKYR